VAQRDRRAMLFRLMAHDLASPLMVISGEIERMNSGDPQVGRMKNSLRQIQEIIQRAKAIEEASASPGDDIPELVDLSESVEVALDNVRERARAKEVHFNFERPKQEVTVPFHRTSLVYHVLENVFSNAIKFSPRGGFVDVEIKDEGGRVKLVISDRGQGFPAEFFNRLRNADYISKRPGTEGEGGSGLGLLIVEAMMKIYGGQMEIANSENQNPGGRVTLIFKVPGPIFSGRRVLSSDS